MTWALKLNLILIKLDFNQKILSEFVVGIRIVTTKLTITNLDLLKNIWQFINLIKKARKRSLVYRFNKKQTKYILKTKIINNLWLKLINFYYNWPNFNILFKNWLILIWNLHHCLIRMQIQNWNRTIIAVPFWPQNPYHWDDLIFEL